MVIIWDVTAKPQARDRVLYRFTDHLAAIKAVEFSADGSLLASGDSAGDIIVWDMENSERAYTLYVESLYNDNRVVSVDISPNLNHVAAAASDWTLRLFTTDTDELAQVAQDRLTRGMTEEECQRYLNKDCSQTNEDANFTTHLIEVPPGIPDLTPTPGSGLFDVRPTPTAAPTLTPTPTETPTPTPVPQVYFYPGTATYCYAGPGENYSALADVIASSPIPVTGITKDYWIEWLQVYNQQLTCWVNGRYGKLNGPLETIPVVEIPPTPTAIP
jgi:WD40 repeat protein